MRGDTAAEVELALVQERPFRVRLQGRETDEPDLRFSVQVEQQLTILVLEDRPQLDEIGDESAQARARRQPPIGQRDGHAYPFARDPPDRVAPRPSLP